MRSNEAISYRLVWRISRANVSLVAICGGWYFGNVSCVVIGKGSCPAASLGRGALSGVRQSELVGIRTGRCHGDLDTALRDAELGADLEKLQPDRAVSRVGKPGGRQADPPVGAAQ